MNLPSSLLELFSSLNAAGIPGRADPGHLLSPQLSPPLDTWLGSIIDNNDVLEEPVVGALDLLNVKLSLPTQLTGEFVGTAKAAEFPAGGANLSGAGLNAEEAAPRLPYFVPNPDVLGQLGAGAGTAGLVAKLVPTLNLIGDPLRDLTGQLLSKLSRTLLPRGYQIRMELTIRDGRGREVDKDLWLKEDLGNKLGLKLPRIIPLPRFYEPAPLAPTLDRFYISIELRLYAPNPGIAEVEPMHPDAEFAAGSASPPPSGVGVLTGSLKPQRPGPRSPWKQQDAALTRTIGPIPVDVPRIPLPTILIMAKHVSLGGPLVIAVPRASMVNCPIAFGDLVQPVKDTIDTAKFAAQAIGVALGGYDTLADYIDKAREVMSQIDVAFVRRDIIDLHALDPDEGVLEKKDGFPKDNLSSILLIGPPTRKVAFYVSRGGAHAPGWFTLQTLGNFVGYIGNLKVDNDALEAKDGVVVRDRVAKRQDHDDQDQWFNDNLSLVRFYPL